MEKQLTVAYTVSIPVAKAERAKNLEDPKAVWHTRDVLVHLADQLPFRSNCEDSEELRWSVR